MVATPASSNYDSRHNDGDEGLMCSVLNVIIDHSMEDPTPMEPEEYRGFLAAKKRKRQRMSSAAAPAGDEILDQDVVHQVPVIRIFGPVLRDPRKGSPLQSACLHIHGAFPYLLARPVVAGPDGSLRRGLPPGSGQVNWDDPESVRQIIDFLASTLEASIQSMDLERQQWQQQKQQSVPAKNDPVNGTRVGSTNGAPSQNLPVVRRITVVQGRGFYTYCPGPPAPFLRVEYYNPKFRWKVKMVLERGLQVPMVYHPDADQYDRGLAAAGAAPQANTPETELHQDIGGVDLLRFHCYEAHIPYTMQFFKDWNLAGMSYLHVQEGKVRSCREPSTASKYRAEPFDRDRDSSAVFLPSNTPSKYLWTSKSNTHTSKEQAKAPSSTIDTTSPPTTTALTTPTLYTTTIPQASSKPTSVSMEHAPEQRSQVQETEVEGLSLSSHSFLCKIVNDPDFEPPKRGTSADVEIDCTVQDLRNIDSVLKSMPSDQDERDKIQWRAVPSLQEIWRQERQRMAKLLPPKHDFLSHPLPSESQGRSGKGKTSSAALSVSKPTTISTPFTLNVKQDAERSGARLAWKGMASLVKETEGLEEAFRRCLQQILTRHKSAVDKIDQDLLQAKQKQKVLLSPVSCTDSFQTPMVKRKLASEYSCKSNSDRKAESRLQLTPNVDEAIEALAALTKGVSSPGEESLNDAVSALESLRNHSQPRDERKTTRLSSLHPIKEGMREDEDDSVDEFLADDDGDSVLSTQIMNCSTLPGEQIGEAIDKRLSYSSSQEMLDDEPLTMMDPIMYSQRLERGDSIVFDTGRDLEDYIDPETLLPYEHLDFGEDRCRAKFSVLTDPVGSIRVCGNFLEACQREGHNDDAEVERARPGYYKTITTGAIVDGLIDTSHAEHDDEEEDNDKFEHALSMMATQLSVSETCQSKAAFSCTPAFPVHRMLTQEFHEESSDADLTCVGVSLGVGANFGESEEEEETSIDENQNQKSMVFKSSSIQGGPTAKDYEPPMSYPAWVTPAIVPPSRAISANSKTPLHVMGGENESCSWLLHVTEYVRNFDPAQFVPGGVNQTYIKPVVAPPSRRRVQSWCKKRNLPQVSYNLKKKMKRIPCAGAKNRIGQIKKPVLEIDSNSRKLVAATTVIDSSHSTRTTPSILQYQDIEEVQWQTSQPWPLSMSQLSQYGESKRFHVLDPKARLAQNCSARGEDDGVSVPHDEVANTNAFEQQSSATSTPPEICSKQDALAGIGAQGGRIHIQGGGTLKAKTRLSQDDKVNSEDKIDVKSGGNFSNVFLHTPLSFMSIEIHVQCRTGASRLDSKKISMAPDSSKDKIFAIVYVYGIDPGGGESLQVLERQVLFTHFEREKDNRDRLAKRIESSMPCSNYGKEAPLKVECLENESRLLIRFSSLVRMKDPDMLLSWDTQGAGLGYIIERGIALGGNLAAPGSDTVSHGKRMIDMVRLLGRTPQNSSTASFLMKTSLDSGVSASAISPLGQASDASEERKWKGSGLGSDWDERVGAGAAAASIVGRLVFASWKIVAEEVKHANYSYLPAIAAAVLNKRVPHHDDLTLTQWYSSSTERWRVLHHRLNQAMLSMLLFDALDIVGRAGEAARLSGVEFSQSFPGIRGSQYKVEGVLLRALQSLRSDERGTKRGKKFADKSNCMPSREHTYGSLSSSEELKSLTQSPWKLRRGLDGLPSCLESRHYFFFSPSMDDTNKQEALEVQALTLEPESGHYEDPVVVCDFTALYPSLVIAYNLCYSTCAGKLEYHSTRKEMQLEGKSSGHLGPVAYPELRTATVLRHHFKSLNGSQPLMPEDENKSEMDRAYIAPTGTIFVSEDVLKGVLPQVLDEILTTRAMLKRAAKEYKKNVKNLSPAILRQLEARQLALKYVANVTYGYTSATFSGRCAMPLLADTIVECGRKTLRRAINMANSWGRGKQWSGARVIYGDTDSLFIKLPGRSYKEAFDFGEELCRAVTADNPPPVQLKLEKVYAGSIMQTMKRYCGMKFDSRHQKKPTFEAKGLETVRRDQCTLTQKVLRNALVTLFSDGISGVREYLHRQWWLIEAGQIPVADFILTGRVRGKYRGGRDGPVQAILAKRIGEADPGRIIRNKERLPYVIVATPGVTFRLKDCVLTPLELLERWDAYTIHSAYYIERHVNASLQRCLGLSPHYVDINAWYQACPKPRRRIHFWPVRSRSRAMITTYFGSDSCSLCKKKCQASGRARVVVCHECRKDSLRASQKAMIHLNKVESTATQIAKECSMCNGCFEDAESFASLREPTVPGARRDQLFNWNRGDLEGKALQIPLANCVCIDCPNTYKRHRLREELIEATATCEVLDLV